MKHITIPQNKFRNKFRITSARAQWWDYGNNADYFITICTENKIHHFGEISVQLNPSEIGLIVEKYWFEIPKYFPYAILGTFVVMPNHIHGIITIDKTNFNDADELQNKSANSKQIGGFSGNKNPMLNNNLSRIMRWYKGRCSFEIRKINREFKWQPKFYDHIIRNESEYQRIHKYIETNPLKWKNDRFYKRNN
jgi:putative transposase